MPQILLEYSSNISDLISIDFPYKTVLKEVHRILNEVGGIKLGNCKSRVVAHSMYYLADGSNEHAMLHLEIAFIEGRSDELKRKMGQMIMEYIQNYLNTIIPELENKLKIQITIHFQDIMKKSYFKYPSGTI